MVSKKKSVIRPSPVIQKKKSVSEDPEVKKEVLALVAATNKRFGTNALYFGVPEDQRIIQRIPTGSISLDISLGGGLPVGRYIQISGAYSASKTTQTILIMKSAQALGFRCFFGDAEGTTSKTYLQQLGVDTNSLLYATPDGLEECTQIILDLQRSGKVQFGVIDSIAALTPTKEYEADMGESVQMGIKQKKLDEFLRKYQSANNRLQREGKTPFTLVGINQLREKIGQMFGDPEYTPGGRAKDFVASVDIRFRIGDWISQGSGESKEMVGNVIKYKINKNKTFKRMQTGEFDFYFTENDVGVISGHNDNAKSAIIEAVLHGLVRKSGGWYYLQDGSKFNGLDKLVEHLRKNDKLIKEFRDNIVLGANHD